MHVDETCDSNLAKPERPIPDDEWMQEHTHLTRLFGRAAIPLTRLSERAGAAIVDAGSVHHTLASIGFTALAHAGSIFGLRCSEAFHRAGAQNPDQRSDRPSMRNLRAVGA